MIQFSQCSQCLAIVMFGFALVGCGDSNTPPLGEVQGQVTFNDAPVDGCNVVFVPLEGGRSSSAVTDSDGRYVLKFNATSAGALVGEHKVQLTTGRDRVASDEGALRDAGRKEFFPKEYNSETTQIVEVSGRKNVIDFHVVGK